MAYIVLAAGAVMVLIGAIAIATGYPIIQVERGFSTVIAGTSLLAGGIITMALALVLRAVTDLRLTLMMPDSERTRHSLANRAIEPLFAPRTETATPQAPSILTAATIAVPTAALALHETAEANPSEPHHTDDAAHDHDGLAEPAPAASAAHPEAPVDQRPQDESPYEAPPLDDWLDRAFADLHEPAIPEPPAAEHLAIEHPVAAADPYVEQAPATQLHDDHVASHADPHAPHHQDQVQEVYAETVAHAEPSPAAHVASEPTSAVIGRYEADGTSYTMYADGSIDAQSESGIYRFASMAELKAFIEG